MLVLSGMISRSFVSASTTSKKRLVTKHLLNFGVIAQELETVCPGLVYETADRDNEGNDLGTTTKAVKSSILTKKALVALQEAMERIETLESEVAALKAS